MRVGFQLAYYDVAVEHVGHNTTGSPSQQIICIKNSYMKH